jgi:hypothetical protein
VTNQNLPRVSNIRTPSRIPPQTRSFVAAREDKSVSMQLHTVAPPAKQPGTRFVGVRNLLAANLLDAFKILYIYMRQETRRVEES